LSFFRKNDVNKLLGDLLGDPLLAEVTNYYMFGGARVAMRQANNEVFYLFGDHLGSSSLVVDWQGRKISEMRYAPWGETRWAWELDGEGYSNRLYTSQIEQNRNYVGQLYDYGARFLNVTTGRFVSADIFIDGGNNNPKGLNRYLYAQGNPIRYNDPTGHCALLCTTVVGAFAGALIVGGTYAAVSAYNGNFDLATLGKVSLAGGVAGGLIGSGVGFAAGVEGLSIATSVAIGNVAIGAGANSLAAGEGYLLSQGLSGQNIEMADFQSNVVVNGVAGGLKALPGVGTGLGIGIDGIAGGTQSAYSDYLKGKPIDPVKAIGSGTVQAASSAIGNKLIPNASIKNQYAFNTGIGEPLMSNGVKFAAQSVIREKLPRALVTQITKSSLLNAGTNLADGYRDCKVHKKC
jgi:RHS repeat-associated protein